MKNTVYLLSGAVVVYAIYKLSNLYQFADKAVGEVTDDIAEFWVSLDGHVELTDFHVSRLRREHFDANWQILPNVHEIYAKSYPSDMAIILTSGGILKPEYRGEVS